MRALYDEDTIRRRFREERAKEDAIPDDALVHFMVGGDSMTMGELRALDPHPRTSEDELLSFDLVCAAAGRNDVPALERLLAKEWADVNAEGNEGWTALMIAAREGSLEAAAFLIENGANVNALMDADEDTPLTHAVWGGHLDVVRLLLSRGAKDPNGRLARHAREQCNSELLELFERSLPEQD
jgi:hypothetical protein